jgi:serine/threonine protein kinase
MFDCSTRQFVTIEPHNCLEPWIGLGSLTLSMLAGSGMKTCPLCEKSYADAVNVCDVDSATLVVSGQAKDPLADSVIKGRYRVLHKVGAGGMGTVYLAEHITLRRKVALKILDPSYGNDAEFVNAFERAARVAANVNHGNLVSLVDFDKLDDGSLLLAMEYVEGRKLSDMIQQEGPLDVLKALRFGIQMAEGLDAVHREGVVHGKVTSQNIIIMSDGESLKLMDFGIAPSRGDPEVVGPDPVVKSAKVVEQTDLYAVGVVLYQMLTGEIPLNATATGGTVPVAPGTMREEISPTIDYIVRQCLHRTPEIRQLTMRDLADSLRLVVSAIEEEESGGTLTATAPADIEVREPRRIGWNIAGGVIAIVAGAAAFFLFGPDSPPEKPRTNVETQLPSLPSVGKKRSERANRTEKGDEAPLGKRHKRDKLARSRAEAIGSEQAVLKEKAARELARRAETDRIARQKETSKSAVKGLEQKSLIAGSPAELKESPP